MLRITEAAVLLVALIYTSQIRVGEGQPSTVNVVSAAPTTSSGNDNDRFGSFLEGEDRLGIQENLSDYEDDHDFAEHGDELDDDDEHATGTGTVSSNDYITTGRRALRRRNRHREELKGSRALKSSSGKGKGKSKSKHELSRDFLDPDIEPIPYINCIPPPPRPKSKKSKIKSHKSMKGKGKGKGHTHNRRRSRMGMRSSMSKRELRGKSKGGAPGRASVGGRDKLPYCPYPDETIFPTSLPSFTPFPSYTPIPTVTPFPSFTPVPTANPPSARPSISRAPSSAPSLSDAPSFSRAPSGKPTSAKPTTISSGPTTRVVPSRLGYGFFTGTTVREPTAAELTGLQTQTELYYTSLLRSAFPGSFTSFTMSNVVLTYNAASNLPVVLDFNANLVFSTNDSQTPTVTQIFNVMDSADLQVYIQMYVWESQPKGTSLFFDTQRVSFGTTGQVLV